MIVLASNGRRAVLKSLKSGIDNYVRNVHPTTKICCDSYLVESKKLFLSRMSRSQ